MNRSIPIVLAAFVVSGCASSAVHSPPVNDREAILQNDYYQCMERTGNDDNRCAKEKDRLLNEHIWNTNKSST